MSAQGDIGEYMRSVVILKNLNNSSVIVSLSIIPRNDIYSPKFKIFVSLV